MCCNQVRGSPFAADKRRGFRLWRQRARRRTQGSGNENGDDNDDNDENAEDDGDEGDDKVRTKTTKMDCNEMKSK